MLGYDPLHLTEDPGLEEVGCQSLVTQVRASLEFN